MKVIWPLILALSFSWAPAWACGNVHKDQSADATPGATTGSVPRFRWPVQSKKIIVAICAPPDGASGINIAVAEGTPIEAAEDGVVAYAGDYLKAYGNMMLVRHSNGYYTAYAHASRLLAKRDDQVKRGRVIALSGQTGNVSSPQLHFEVRKGSMPVDPLLFLEP